jgi:Tol biopolymer transport system component
VAFLPDGKDLVTTSFATSFTNGGTTERPGAAHLNVFSIATGQLVAQPQDKVYENMVASPTGKYLIAGGASEAVGQGTAWDLWDTTSWSIVRTYTNVADFSWSPDGSQIALVRNGSVQIVDAQSDNVLRSFASGAGTIANIAWQPHGTCLLVNINNASAQTSYLSLWDTQTGAHLYTLNSYQGAFNDGSAWSSDGKYVLFSTFSMKAASTVNPAATLTPPPTQLSVAQWDEVIWIAG